MIEQFAHLELDMAEKISLSEAKRRCIARLHEAEETRRREAEKEAVRTACLDCAEKDAEIARLKCAEDALRIIARNTRAGAVTASWIRNFVNEVVETLDA